MSNDADMSDVSGLGDGPASRKTSTASSNSSASSVATAKTAKVNGGMPMVGPTSNNNCREVSMAELELLKKLEEQNR